MNSTVISVAIPALDFKATACVKDLLKITPRPADLFFQIKNRRIAVLSVTAEVIVREG